MTNHAAYRPFRFDSQGVLYDHGPDSFRRPGVPPGRTIELHWDSSSIYPGTSRRVWIHIPDAYDPAEAAGLAVFQDGWWYLDPDGDVRGAIVLDNLVHSGDIPVTVGVFVDPGVFESVGDPSLRKNRNAEYDAFDSRYGSFLVDEIVREVRSHVNVSDNPDRWAIIGGSSGGDCAFTAAWHHTDRFRRVVCFLSSFAQIPGGNPYPELIPNTPRKPLRIVMQAGHRDLRWNQPERNWLAENLRVGAALAEAGYDFHLVLGDGGHNANHAGVLLPDALRWLWREPIT